MKKQLRKHKQKNKFLIGKYKRLKNKNTFINNDIRFLK
jgi:hypothetical protein